MTLLNVAVNVDSAHNILARLGGLGSSGLHRAKNGLTEKTEFSREVRHCVDWLTNQIRFGIFERPINEFCAENKCMCLFSSKSPHGVRGIQCDRSQKAEQ
jgi:hypothetical protein